MSQIACYVNSGKAKCVNPDYVLSAVALPVYSGEGKLGRSNYWSIMLEFNLAVTPGDDLFPLKASATMISAFIYRYSRGWKEILGASTYQVLLLGMDFGIGYSIGEVPLEVTWTDNYKFQTDTPLTLRDYHHVAVGMSDLSICPGFGCGSLFSVFGMGEPVHEIIDMSGWDSGYSISLGYSGSIGMMKQMTGQPPPPLP